MKRIRIAVTLAVLGFGASAAFANPTLDTSPNSVWRQAPEATSFQARTQPSKLEPAYEQETPYVFNP